EAVLCEVQHLVLPHTAAQQHVVDEHDWGTRCPSPGRTAQSPREQRYAVFLAPRRVSSAQSSICITSGMRRGTSAAFGAVSAARLSRQAAPGIRALPS